ncbi:uncharacterized protein LOC143047445 isoform X1 [Mytilus galloprovincialis]|uniref:uncharacterized protein LOC143047445 isoform X1 n=1 Tax=Mytilus galloprovincialis TaxID=29158 RepID=UPI003F7B843C
MDLECHFVGRGTYFEALLERWEDLRCVGVYGMRSIGKSRFVKQLLHFVSKHFNDNDYTAAWVDLRNLQSLRQIFLTLFEKCEIHQSIDGDDDELYQAILTYLSKTNRTFFIIFDNAEDAIDSDFNPDFINLIKDISDQSAKVKVLITSTSHLQGHDFCHGDVYKYVELLPLSMQESRDLLHMSAPSVDFGIYLDKIVELCEGLPLALLLTGSELEQDDGLLEPCDMVELLNKCRLKVLSQDLYPIQERIAPMYRQFLNRLSTILKEKLGILSYIPGTFSAQQAARLLDEESDDITMTETLIPIVQRHVVQYDKPSKRFDIHGILRDCISEFLKIQNLPEIRKRYCKMFAELMHDICDKMETSQYAEALSMYNMEQQNFQKLMTDVMYTTEDTYPVYVDLATTAFPTMTRFVGDNKTLLDTFTFIEQVLQLTRSNREELDEAFVSVTYGSVLTNLKGDFHEGEKSYNYSISVMAKYNVSTCLMKIRAHQGLGWNLGCQGKSAEALSTLKKAFQYETELGMENEDLILQTLQCLALFNTFAGFLDEGEFYHLKVLKKRRDLYGTDENPSIGACFNNMGILYKQKGDHSKALEYYQAGLDIKRKTKATDKAIVISMNNVASTLSELGRHDEGIDILNEAFDIVNKYPGFLSDCRDLSNDTMGLVYLHKKDFYNAIKYFNRGLKGRLESSPNHICVLEEKTRLAEAYVGLGQYSVAQTDLVETLKCKEGFIKQMPQNTFIYDSYKILMEVSRRLGDKKSMESYFTNCKVEIYRLTDFFEDLGNLTRAKEMADNLKLVQKIYYDFMRGRRG